MHDIQPAIANAANPAYGEGAHNPLSTDLAGNLRVVTAGGGGAVTIADGADVTEGSIADVAVVIDAPGTLSAKLRGIIVILLRMFDLGTPIRNQQVGISTGQIVDGGGNPVTVTANRLDVNASLVAAFNAGISDASTGRVVQATANVVNITQVTVPIAAGGILVIAANANRIKVRVTNTGSNPVYMSQNNVPTVLNSDFIPGIAGYPWISRYAGALYGIATGGNQLVTVYEESSV